MFSDSQDEPLLKKTSALSSASATGAVVTVQNLSFALPSSGQGQATTVLENVSFTCLPGETTAIMGKAGPWMPNLMKLLASQCQDGVVKGSIKYDGNDSNPQWRHLIQLVSKEEQFDCISCLTVFETLQCMAKLRLGAGYTDQERAARADEVVNMLGLQKCRNVRIGSSLVRGISGGEKKRLGIGVGLIASPKVVLLDEPTTGLDSTTALEVMGHVHEAIAKQARKTLITSIHMPASEVFALFSKLLIFNDGQLAYCGPATDVVDYFSQAPYNSEIKARENPADFILAVIATGSGRSQVEGGAAFNQAFVKTPQYAAEMEATSKAAAEPRIAYPPHVIDWAIRSRQIFALLRRTLTQFARSTSIWRTEIFKMAWIAFLYSTSYSNQPLNTTGKTNLCSCFYFSLMFGILGNLRGIVTLFDERLMYEHERTNRCYDAVAFWLVTSFAQLPWLVFMNLLFSTTVFFSVGLGKVDGVLWVFCYYCLITTMTNLIGFAWAQMLASFCSTSQNAMSIWQPGVYIWAQTSGFPIQMPSISHSNPAWMLMTISFTRWAYEALVIAVFHKGWGDVTATTVFNYYGFNNCPLWAPIPIMLFYIVAVRCVTYFPLREKPDRLVWLGSDDSIGKLGALPGAGMGAAQGAVSVAMATTADGGNASEAAALAAAPTTTPVTVEVRSMHYSVRLVDNAGAKFVKPLLRGVSVTCLPGETCAIMGPSGAGKSTFLDLIAGRKTTGFGRGELLYNGKTPSFDDRSELEAYVMQHDVLIPNLTVIETLRLAAMLRLKRPSPEVVNERAQTVLMMLGLEAAANTLVSGLSPGQRRLAAVSVEIVHLPALVYLDEPTSGLDSDMSLQFVRAIKRLAACGKTVVCTIHQPTETIFRMFDKLLVIGDGVARYVGTPDNSMGDLYKGDAEQYAGRNPALQLMDFVKDAPKPDPIDCEAEQAASHEPGKFDYDAEYTRGGGGGVGGALASAVESLGPESILSQCYHFKVHLLRNLMILGHTRRSQYIALARNVVVAVWYGVVYFDQTEAHTLASVCYFSQQFITMSNLQAIPMMFAERPLFYRERAAGYYSELPYLAARCFVNACIQGCLALVYCLITYPMVGLRGGVFSSYFVFFYLIMLGLAIAGYAFSNFIAAITPNQQSALNLYSAIFQFFMFFCGYSIPVSEVPPGWSWATSVSFARWSFESLALNQFQGEDPDADDSLSPNFWLGYWGFTGMSKWHSYGTFIFFVAVFHVISWAAMKLISFERR